MGDVDAARLQSVRAAGGTGYIYTNNDLFVLHARITCKQFFYMYCPDTPENI